jgi:hypothetical protein
MRLQNYHYPPFKRWSQIKEENYGLTICAPICPQSAHPSAHNLRTHLPTIYPPICPQSAHPSARILSPIDKTSIEHRLTQLSFATLLPFSFMFKIKEENYYLLSCTMLSLCIHHDTPPLCLIFYHYFIIALKGRTP